MCIAMSTLTVVERTRAIEGTALQAQRQASADWPQPVQQHTFSKDDWYVLQFDGGARGNPGPSGAGAAIFHCAVQKGAGVDGQDNLALSELVWTSSIYVSDFSTCNEAEYTGMVQGLAAALQLGIKVSHLEGITLALPSVSFITARLPMT
jgi:Reverse transcriptase-like